MNFDIKKKSNYHILFGFNFMITVICLFYNPGFLTKD